jgi:hypothetical protein
MTVSLGEDIREVYPEIGAAVNIISRDPVVTGEWVIYEVNAQVTKPFIREHHLDATFPYDTLVTTDDVVEIIETGYQYLVMNKTPEMFENNAVEWNIVLYKCNLPLTACILRPLEIRDSVSYEIIQGWHVVVDSPVYGLISDRIFGSEISQEEVGGAGQFPIYKIDLYLPKYYGVKSLDRVIISETEYYKVETIENHYYPGVCTVLLVEDTRPATTFIDGEVYEDG